MTETYYSARLLLKQCPAEGVLSGYADDREWSRTDGPQATWVASPVLRVHYREDEGNGNCYAYVEGEIPFFVQAMATTLVTDLDIWTPDELVRAVDEATDEANLGQALIRLAMGAPQELDERILPKLAGALTHPSERVRELVVWATSYPAWPELRRALARVAEQDESEHIRNRAQQMLDSFDAAGVEQG